MAKEAKKVKKVKKGSKKRKKVILFIIALLFLAGIVYLGPKLIKVYRLNKEANKYVSSCSVSTFKDSKTTIIYDAAGQQLCTMKKSKDMYYVEYSQIPSTLADAFVVMEDRQFYDHSGVDFKAIIRAIVVNQKSNDIAQGASTITQQLARNIFLTQEVSWERKVEEMFISVGLEKKFSKNQILEFYLNNIYFGNGYYGVEAAAKGYFSKSVSDLTLAEQAFIAAIPNNPTKYNPLTNYEKTVKRKNLILSEMYNAGMITGLDYYMAKDDDVILNEQQVVEANNSAVTYARHCATESLMSVSGFSFRYNFDTQDEYDRYENSYETYYTMCQQKLLSGGYTVYTSIDTTKQQALQDAIDSSLSGYKALADNGVYSMQGAATSIDNATGNVVAIVGSRSQDEIKGYTLNRAYQSSRQPGSSIKPLLVYTPYIQIGNTPDTIVTDEKIDNGPVNADGVFSGDITFREAVRTSKNTIAWKMLQKITPRSGMAFLIKMNFGSVWMDKDHIASALGGFTYGVTTEEMAGGYAAIANDGVYRKATCVEKIVDSANKTIVDETKRGFKVYDANSCKMMTDMLKTVVTEGTGVTAAPDNAIVAGKTGTTNSTKDAWFCGYSKYYTTAVWMGYDYPKEIETPMANEIFKQYMTKIHEGLPKTDFAPYAVSSKLQAETTSVKPESTTAIETETVSQIETETTLPAKQQEIPQQTTTMGNTQNAGGLQTTQNNQKTTNGNTNRTKQQQTTQAPTVKATKSQIDVDATTIVDKDADIKGGDW